MALKYVHDNNLQTSTGGLFSLMQKTNSHLIRNLSSRPHTGQTIIDKWTGTAYVEQNVDVKDRLAREWRKQVTSLIPKDSPFTA